MHRDDWRTWNGEMDWDDDPSSAAPPDEFVASTYIPGVWPAANAPLPPLEPRRAPRLAPPPPARGRTTARIPAAPPAALTHERTTARIPAAPSVTGQRAAWADLPTVSLPTRQPPAAPRSAPRAPLPVRARRERDRQDLRAFCEAPTGKRRTLPAGVAIIPGNARPAPRLPRHRRSIAGLVAFGLAGVVLFAVTMNSAAAVSGPASFDALAADVGSLGGMSGSADTPNPTLAWQAQVGVVPVLGGGGAAAPGVNAPGTASQAPVNAPAPTVQPSPTVAQPAATTPPAPKATAAPAKPATPKPATPKPATPKPASTILPAPVKPWPPTYPWMSVPGHRPYAVTEPPNDPYRVAFGQCTWWAQHERRDQNLRGMGNARYWASGARARGYRVGTTPATNATVVVQPGYQGAGGAGHVAHVMALYPGGWFLVSEMNAYGNGGGWGRVSFRYMHAGPGIQFIY